MSDGKNELKPCPFCGNEHLDIDQNDTIFIGQIYSDRYPEKVANQNHGFKVRCVCGCQTCWWHYEAEAKNKWNTRTGETQ